MLRKRFALAKQFAEHCKEVTKDEAKKEDLTEEDVEKVVELAKTVGADIREVVKKKERALTERGAKQTVR